jgi:hypothetical protein
LCASDPLAQLKFAQELRNSYHTALWEEEKHYTWFISLVAGAEAAIIAQVVTPPDRAQLLSLLGVVGFVLSVLALVVVRAESRNFQQAHGRFVRLYNAAFSTEGLPVPDIPDDQANHPILILPILFFTGELRIRDAFQFVFVMYALLNAILILYSLPGTA